MNKPNDNSEDFCDVSYTMHKPRIEVGGNDD